MTDPPKDDCCWWINASCFSARLPAIVFTWLTLENSKQSLFHWAKLKWKRNLTQMFQCYQDFHSKVKCSGNRNKAEKIPSEAFKHQTLKNVTPVWKRPKAEVMGCLVQGWSASVNQHRQLTEVSLSFSSAVNLLKLQKQGWEEYCSAYWKIIHRMFLTSSFLAWKPYWHSEPTLEKKNYFENQMPAIKLYFHIKKSKYIFMWKVAKEKCFAKVNTQNILKHYPSLFFIPVKI